jgi:hypothetical protein
VTEHGWVCTVQLSTLLKSAVMFDHQGTYMRAIALQQKNARVVVATGPDFEENITGAPFIQERSLMGLLTNNLLPKKRCALDQNEPFRSLIINDLKK